ncbi:hypothetical protein QL285_057133 [Trifolium repens]|nr:hypothetical protein QL285_057133 [Trifolium repens]
MQPAQKKKTPANQQQQRGFRLLASPLFAFMPPSYSHRRRRTTTVTNNPNVVAIVLSQTIIDFQNIRDKGNSSPCLHHSPSFIAIEPRLVRTRSSGLCKVKVNNHIIAAFIQKGEV